MAALPHTLPQRGQHRRSTTVAIVWVTLALVAALLASADAAALPTDPEPATEVAAPFTLNSSRSSTTATSTLIQSATGDNSFTAVSAGGGHTCGLQSNDTITCWGLNDSGQADAPSGTFKTVTAGVSHTCGLQSNDTITCWGNNDYGQADAPSGTFKTVTAGVSHTCGLQSNDTITCWGYNDFGQADAPSGTFKTVTAGWGHTCGLQSNDTITCWGRNAAGQADAPSGTFKTVTAGLLHTCGLQSNDTITCWGYNDVGQADAPSGTFKTVTAGLLHTCGLQSNDTITCWGRNDSGEADAPSGTFKTVTAGGSHTCGLQSDGVIVCWGPRAMRTADPVAGVGGPTVTLSGGGPGPTALRPGEGIPCAPNTPTCRYLNVELQGFAAGTYTVSCSHDGWGNFGPSTFWTFSITVDSSGSASRSGPCFLNLARLTGNGAYVTVSRNGTEVARSGWLGGTPSDSAEPASELAKVTGARFLTRVIFFGLNLPSVSWDAVPGAASYEVEWSTAGAEDQRGSVDAGVACCTHQGGVLRLLANQVRVRAVNDDGEGPWSDVAAAPVRPGKVTGIAYRSGSAVWDAVEGAASYDVAWKYGGEKPRIVQGLDRVQLRIARVEGKSIRMTVRAVNDSGSGPWSSWKTIVAPSGSVPAKVVGLNYRGNSALWSPVEGATSYRLTVEYRCVIDCDNAQSQDLNATRTFSTACVTRCSYRIFSPGVQRDVPVRFRVSAKNSAGAGPLSDWRTAEEVKPGPVILTSASPGEVWYDPDGPSMAWPDPEWRPVPEATSYQIEIVQSGTVLSRDEVSVASPRPAYSTYTGLKISAECASGQRHASCDLYYGPQSVPKAYDPCRTATLRVRAVNGAGAGPWAASTISSIKPPKPYVTNLEVVGGLFSFSAKDVRVTWRDMVCTDGYDVEWRYLDQGEARSLCFHDGGCVASDVERRVSGSSGQYRWHGVPDVADNAEDKEYRLQFRVRGKSNSQGVGEWSDWASLQSYRVGREINDAVSRGSLACAGLEVAEFFAEYVLDALLLISAYFTGGGSLVAWALLFEVAERTKAFGADKKTLVVKGIKILAGCYPSPGVALADATPVLGLVLSVTGANKRIERMYDCTEFVADNPNVWESDWNERAKAAGCEVN